MTTATYLPIISSVGSGTTEEGGTVSAAAINATHVVKYYYFGGQRVAMSRNGSFRYLHGDHLGSTIAETNTSGQRTTWREYTAYGARRAGSSLLATDRTYTGQQADETGLMYYSARYYDPSIGAFISPDTIVPDAGNVLDYNRYMMVRGNPLRYSDPTGHQSCELCNTTIPGTAARENMLSIVSHVLERHLTPTSASISIGGNMSAGVGLHGEGASELQATFNWHSGQFMVAQTNSGGMKGGPMIDVSAGIHIGGAVHFNASSTDSLQNASVYLSSSAEVEAGLEAGIYGTVARSSDYKDWNKNEQFDFSSESFSALTPVDNGRDPVFDRPIVSLSSDLTVGVDAVSNGAEAGFSAGASDTNEIFTVDVYAPFRWLSNLISE